ncbi:DEAD/DEAH box helicase family protein [Candidatus Uhrbacteria bacterium]|nr:DEAD/DEAH box helicase family protein [Candidatus Uhrbacteria bacterium]
MLKEYQQRVIRDVESFFTDLDKARQSFYESADLQKVLGSYVDLALTGKYAQWQDRAQTGAGTAYPRACIKMPTGGGKTLVAIETIRAYQNIFAKRKTGLVVWITHRDQIYRQTIDNLQNKGHYYRQLLDQASGNRTLIVEKGQHLRRQDIEENLVVLMLMIQSATRGETNKMFEDSGYTDFFPAEGRYDLHRELVGRIPNLDHIDDPLFSRVQVRTSLGNAIRLNEPLIVVDEFHTMFTDTAKRTLDGLNPSVIIGLSATPKRGMNIVSSASGKDLKAEEMIKLDMHLIPPARSGDWHSVLGAVKSKRESLEESATRLEKSKGTYIRPIALLQVERTGRDQRGQGYVHSEDVREFLIELGVPAHQIAVKSSSLDEIKAQKLLSRGNEMRYIITKEALKEGWDCSFAYVLCVIPNARTNSSMTQLVGRILRQPYAKKTGINELDESYVYFAKGQTEDVLDHVKRGFEDEGLGDVQGGIEAYDRNGEIHNPPKEVSIKREIREKYPESLFLPTWLIKEGKNRYRPFSYEIDIKPGISWDVFPLLPAWLDEIVGTIGKQKARIVERIIGLEGEGGVRELEATTVLRFDTFYLARRIAETIDNAFIAHEIAKEIVSALNGKTDAEALDADAGYIASEIERRLGAHKRGQEKSIFENLIKSKKLELVVSDDEAGFHMPLQDSIANDIPSSYQLNLFEDVEHRSFNTLEKKAAQIIDQSKNVIWWARNKTERGWYAVQGWQRNKIRPDFVIARKDAAGNLEFVYVVETKGEQLLGNDDTLYKTGVFERMNEMEGNIKKERFRTTTVRLNDRFKFELIPQGEEEARLRSSL